MSNISREAELVFSTTVLPITIPLTLLASPHASQSDDKNKLLQARLPLSPSINNRKVKKTKTL